MSGGQFSSNAEEIRYYIKQLLQDGAIHGIEEMRSYVERHSSNSANFTTGMYTGAIRDLVRNSGGIMPIRFGAAINWFKSRS